MTVFSVGFHYRYGLLNIALLAIIVLIAVFVHDTVVRPFLGDVLIVIWMFLFCMTFVRINPWKLSICLLIFSYMVEIAQGYHLVRVLGLEHCHLARIILGSTFDVMDFVAYTCGWLVIVAGLTCHHRVGGVKRLWD